MPPERLMMLGAVAVWAIVSMLSRAWGGVLGAVMGVGVAIWGHFTMQAGREVTLLGWNKPLQPEAFYVICSFLVFINAMTAVQSFRRTRAAKNAPPAT